MLRHTQRGHNATAASLRQDVAVSYHESTAATTTATATGAVAPGWRPMSDGERTAFSVLSASTAPVWLAMILAPRSRVTAALVRWSTPLSFGLGAAYVGLLGASAVRGAAEGEGFPRFDDPEVLRAGLTSPTAFLAGWTHYLVFDLLVGRSIHEHALEHGRTARLSLLLTWWAGPAGLALHLLDRWRRR